MRIELYEDNAGEYRWRMKADNGEPMADSGEGYVDRSGVRRAARTYLTAMTGTPNPGHIVWVEKWKDEPEVRVTPERFFIIGEALLMKVKEYIHGMDHYVSAQSGNESTYVREMLDSLDHLNEAMDQDGEPVVVHAPEPSAIMGFERRQQELAQEALDAMSVQPENLPPEAMEAKMAEDARVAAELLANSTRTPEEKAADPGLEA